jgi:hypothetical protein
MTETHAPAADSRLLTGAFQEALAYEAPFLIEKLLKERIVETAEEGLALFAEVKKFFVLVHLEDTLSWDMYSLRVDEVWHQFVLFTREYTDFCMRFFGHYIEHAPSNAPPGDAQDWREEASFEDLQGIYQELFGGPLPDAWYDDRSVTPRRRVLNDFAGKLSLRDEGDRVGLLAPDGNVLLSVDGLGREALAFIAHTGAFYVREVPGGLTDEEKVALVAALVQGQVLRVGS